MVVSRSCPDPPHSVPNGRRSRPASARSFHWACENSALRSRSRCPSPQAAKTAAKDSRSRSCSSLHTRIPALLSVLGEIEPAEVVPFLALQGRREDADEAQVLQRRGDQVVGVVLVERV